MSATSDPRPALLNCALLGFVLGGAALIFVLVHFVSGPFAPQPQTAVSLGELASGMVKSAARDMMGMQQPAPEALPWDIDRILRGAGMAVGGMAIMLGILGLVRGESPRLSTAAMVLGTGAIVVQMFFWALAMILCTLLLIAFVNMIGDWSPFA